MFKWLKNLFATTPPHPRDGWVAAPGLHVSVDLGTGELSFGNGQSTNLSQNASSLAPLGAPDKSLSTDLYNYTRHALFINVEDDLIESMSIDFEESTPPSILLNGRPIELTRNAEISEVIALMGPPLAQHDQEFDGVVSTDLEYRLRAGVYSEWNFENGKLSGIDLADYGEDIHEQEVLAEDDEGESTW
jgi:hypothetical protein